MSKLKYFYLLVLSSLLVGCQNNPLPNNDSFIFKPTAENSDLFDNYYVPHQLRYTYQDINKQIGWITSSSIGNQKLLVIPIQLNDGPSWSQKMLNNLNEVFFDSNSVNCYESVTSFFNKSSYNQLNLSGNVLPPYKSKFTVSNIMIKGESAPEAIINELTKDNNYLSDEIINEYDLNSDGYIDNTVLIYSDKYSQTGNGAFWAWSHFNEIDSSSPSNINNYLWASYHFINNIYSDGFADYPLDSHTFIHETGHLLGLDDYYSYDQQSELWNPAGKLDMQSYNIGDHNAFSKLALGWIKPFVVTGSSTIRLKTSSKYPQAILIKDDWNGSAFDEYLLIEYYTPNNLNYLDSIHCYEDDKMYNYSGLRIYHVDARIVNFKENILGQYNPISYSDYILDNNNIYFIGSSNSICNSYLDSPYNKKYRLLHLLDQNETNRLNNGNGGYLVDSKTLWTGEKVFSSKMKFFNESNKFNDNSAINYSIAVSELNEEDCLVQISKI